MRPTLLTIALALCSLPAAAQLDDILKRADDALNHRDISSLSDDKIISGLKQALEIGTSKAVAATGKPDGFLKNEAIKISLPPKLQSVGRGLRMLGMGSRVDELETGMNRAAEQATPQAKQIFLSALKKIPSTTPAKSSPAMTLPPPTTSSAPPPPTSPQPSPPWSTIPWKKSA
jgi:hypothetical protein